MHDVDLEGITDNIPAISNIQVEFGRAISANEVRRHAPVAFIGNDIREQFLRGPRSGRQDDSGGRQSPMKWSARRSRWAACSGSRRTTS